MFASLHVGLCTLDLTTIEGVFVLPVDTPAPGTGVWSSLAQSGELSVPGYRGKRGHPVYLPVAWVRETLARIQHSRVDPGSLRLDTLIAPAVRVVPVDDGNVVVNLNTISGVESYFNTGRAGDESVQR